MPIKFLFSKDVFATVLLLCCAVAAFVFVNCGNEDTYHHLLESGVGGVSLHFFVNDILMAIFFLVVGCEIKREMVVGELSSLRRAMFPVVGALGGMLVPALVYLYFNSGHAASVRGWAIPSATDIAFSLGVLGFFATTVPTSMRIFLTALAIVDDLGAVLIIALFFTNQLAISYIFAIGGLTVVLIVLNKLRIKSLIPYLLLAPVVWYCFHNAGIHATVAGVYLSMFIPAGESKLNSPLEALERRLIPWIKFLILPVFAFANSGVSLQGMQSNMLLQPVPLGVTLGLFFGKQIGVFGFSFLAHKLGIARKPEDSSWYQMYCVAILTGIGFTMSLFIASLAFPANSVLLVESKLGIFAGSIFSAVAGMILLSIPSKKKRPVAI